MLYTNSLIAVSSYPVRLCRAPYYKKLVKTGDEGADAPVWLTLTGSSSNVLLQVHAFGTRPGLDEKHGRVQGERIVSKRELSTAMSTLSDPECNSGRMSLSVRTFNRSSHRQRCSPEMQCVMPAPAGSTLPPSSTKWSFAFRATRWARNFKHRPRGTLPSLS